MQQQDKSDEPIVSWDRQKLERFKGVFAEVKNKGSSKTDSFMFDDLEFLVGYAELLEQYLEAGLEK